MQPTLFLKNGFALILSISPYLGYTMLKHDNVKENPERWKILKSGIKHMKIDGYNSLKYEIIKIITKKLFTRIIVDLPHLKV